MRISPVLSTLPTNACSRATLTGRLTLTQTFCTCGDDIIAGINTQTHDLTVYSVCAGTPYPTIASHTIDPPKPTPTVVAPVDPPSAPSCKPVPQGKVKDAHKDRMWSAVQDFCDRYNTNEPYHSNGIDQKYTWHDDQLTQIFDDNDSKDDVYDMSIESVPHCDPGSNGYNLHYPVESTTCYLVLYDAWTKCKFAVESFDVGNSSRNATNVFPGNNQGRGGSITAGCLVYSISPRY